MRDPSDSEPQGEPETIIVLAKGESLLGLHIHGLTRRRILGVRTDRDGDPLTCAIVDAWRINTTYIPRQRRRRKKRNG